MHAQQASWHRDSRLPMLRNTSRFVVFPMLVSSLFLMQTATRQRPSFLHTKSTSTCCRRRHRPTRQGCSDARPTETASAPHCCAQRQQTREVGYNNSGARNTAPSSYAHLTASRDPLAAAALRTDWPHSSVSSMCEPCEIENFIASAEPDEAVATSVDFVRAPKFNFFAPRPYIKRMAAAFPLLAAAVSRDVSQLSSSRFTSKEHLSRTNWMVSMLPDRNALCSRPPHFGSADGHGRAMLRQKKSQ